MEGVLALICMLAVHMAAAAAAPRSEWDLFKERYGKVYEHPEVDRLRRMIYESSVEIIERHNARHAKGLTSYTMGVNAFADQLDSELFGLSGYSTEIPTYNVSAYQASGLGLPASVDWRREGIVTPVKDQGQCGSCWTFSATGAMEGQYAKSSGRLVSLSEQQILDCGSGPTSFYDNCPAGSPIEAFNYVQQAGGIETEESYPYLQEKEQCNFDQSKVVMSVTGITQVPSESEEDLQEAIAYVGPISVLIDASGMKHYDAGVYDGCPEYPSLDHAVLAVGYGTTSEGVDYYIVKNSWGTGWAHDMGGYILMPRNQNNKCGIASDASYPTLQKIL